MEAAVTIKLTLEEVRDITDSVADSLEIERSNYSSATGADKRASARRIERLRAIAAKL